MRRIAMSLAVLGALTLGACGGGGSVLSSGNNSQPERTIVTVQGSTNIARVLPGGSIAISAIPVRGSQNGYVQGNSLLWSALLVTSGTYTANALGQTKSCGSVSYNPGTGASPLTEDLTLYVTIDPTNESNIIFTPPAIFPLPTGAPAGSTVSPTYPYCVVISATPLDSNRNPQTGAAGSITVAVVNPLNPEQ